ncbi:hypothetical protein ACJX0J_032290, partial [Zea mays]
LIFKIGAKCVLTLTISSIFSRHFSMAIYPVFQWLQHELINGHEPTDATLLLLFGILHFVLAVAAHWKNMMPTFFHPEKALKIAVAAFLT